MYSFQLGSLASSPSNLERGLELWTVPLAAYCHVLLSVDIHVAHVCVLVCWVEFKCWLPWWICRDPVCFALLVALKRTIFVKLSIYLSFFHIDSIFGLWSSILLHWRVI